MTHKEQEIDALKAKLEQRNTNWADEVKQVCVLIIILICQRFSRLQLKLTSSREIADLQAKLNAATA